MKKKSIILSLIILLGVLLLFGVLFLSTTHIYGEVKQTALTCGEEGRTYRTCLLCGKVEYGDSVSPLPHAFGETVRSIRYETAYVECSRCKKIEQRPYEAPKGIARLYIVGTPGGTVIPVSFRYVEENGEQNGYAKVSVNPSIERVEEKPDYDMIFYHDDAFSVNGEYYFGEEIGTTSAVALRAAYYDRSGGAWNLALSSLWERMVETRENREANLDALSHKGAEYGKPILLYTNGNFKGIYTLCAPDDGSLFGLNDEKQGAVLYTYTRFGVAEHSVTADGNEIPVTIIYPKENGDEYVKSFQNMLDFAKNANDAEFTRKIGRYLDVDAMIDYMVYLYVLDLRVHDTRYCHFVTYDGKEWIPSPYALDDGLGRGAYYYRNYPQKPLSPYKEDDTVYSGMALSLYDRFMRCFSDEITARYCFLRADVLSNESILEALEAQVARIPEEVLKAEYEEYPAKNRYGSYVCTITAESLSDLSAADDFFMQEEVAE